MVNMMLPFSDKLHKGCSENCLQLVHVGYVGGYSNETPSFLLWGGDGGERC